MAIALDSASTYKTQFPGTSLTWAHTCTGSDLILIVTVTVEQGDRVTGVTYNGVAMTQGIKAANGVPYLYIYYLVNPATGANNIVVSVSSSSDIHAASASYTGASQTGQPDATNSVNEVAIASGDHTVSLTVVAADSWLVATYNSLTAGPVSAVNGVNRAGTYDQGALFDSNAAVAAGTQTIGMHWNALDSHTIIGLSFKPVAAGPANLKTWDGLAKASIKTINGLAIGSVKTVDGLASILVGLGKKLFAWSRISPSFS